MTTDERPAKQGSTRTDDRGAFERFVQVAHHVVSASTFFYACVALVLVWALSAPLWSNAKDWQVVLHTGVSIITLLLLALLENANRRSDEAAQEKLNLLAEALAALMDSRGANDPALHKAAERLRVSVGLEKRH